MFRIATGFAVMALLGSCATAPTISPPALADLVPTGKLRVGIMYTNPVVSVRDPVTGNLGGIAVDLARELGQRLNVPVELVGYENTAAMLGAMKTGAWDVAFSGYEPTRAELSMTAPYVESDGIYLVRAGSPLRTSADVDREGVRVAVSAKSSLDLHLSRTLKHAQLERIPGAGGAAELFIAGKADVLASVRQQVMRVAAKLPGSRILDGRFMAIGQALAIPAGHDAGAQYLRAYIEDVKASGLVAQLMAKHAISGAAVAPAVPVR